MGIPSDAPLAAPPDEHVAEQPVRHLPGEEPRELRSEPALALSGGGYRAMLFHLGVLWRLNDAAMLPMLGRVSSVSGGSITAGVLAMNWKRLGFDEKGVAREFRSQVVGPLTAMADEGVDVTAVLGGLGLPFTSIADRVVKAYRKHLFGKATLQDLPDDDEGPRFVFNATNLETGVLMRFSKPYLADYRIGRVMAPDLPLAVAVTASSAFPPFLSPCTVDLGHEDWDTHGADLGEEFRREIRLSDGGVYDNLGVETVWKQFRTVLVSDAGGHVGAEPDPPRNWPGHMVRVLKVIDGQVRALRKRQVIEGLKRDQREGMYVGIRSHVEDFPIDDPMDAQPQVVRRLAAVPTRLDAVPDDLKALLVNWGYVACDTGLRAHVMPGTSKGSLPYPSHPLTAG